MLKEMGRVYRLTLNHRISSQEGARLHFMLATIRTTLEIIMDRERPQPPQLEAPTIVITTAPPGHYLTAEQVQQIKAREQFAEFGNGNMTEQ